LWEYRGMSPRIGGWWQSRKDRSLLYQISHLSPCPGWRVASCARPWSKSGPSWPGSNAGKVESAWLWGIFLGRRQLAGFWRQRRLCPLEKEGHDAWREDDKTVLLPSSTTGVKADMHSNLELVVSAPSSLTSCKFWFIWFISGRDLVHWLPCSVFDDCVSIQL
jgi:hypothetical protein